MKQLIQHIVLERAQRQLKPHIKIKVRINITIIILFILTSCEEKLNIVITDISILNNSEYRVSVEADTFLINGYYSASRIPKYSELTNKEIFYILNKNGKLLRKEYFTKEDTICNQIENYDLVFDDLVKTTFLYGSQYSTKYKQKIKEIIISDLNSKKIFFKREFNPEGKVLDTDSEFYYHLAEVSRDSTCISIYVPGGDVLGCTFEFRADANFSSKDTFNLQNITKDSIRGVGEICFANEKKKKEVHFVGESYFKFKDSKAKLVQFKEVLSLN